MPDNRKGLAAAYQRFVEGMGPQTGDIEHDPEYDFIPPRPRAPKAKKGAQCGECGFKWLYGEAIGFSCPRANCPAGFGG